MRTVGFLLLLTGLALAGEPRVDAFLAQGDAAARRHDTRGALTAFHAAEELEPKNSAIHLRLSRQYSNLVSETKSAAARAAAEKSLTYAQRATELEPKNAKAHLSLAVAYGKLTDFVGNKTKVEYSKTIRDEAAKSIALDPTDDYAWHVLGRWHFGVANVNPMLRALAKVVYGGIPPASNQEALRHLKKASELAPQRIIHRSELARIYTTMGQHDLAAKEWKTVLALPAADKEDEADKREARASLAGK